MTDKKKSLLKIICGMLLFGPIGIVKQLVIKGGSGIDSGLFSVARGLIGAAALLAFIFICGKKPDFKTIKPKLWLMVLSGAMIGFNWVLLFEAADRTGVSVATLCYYFAPIIVILLSPVIFRERLTVKKLICVAAAVAGMMMISGIFGENVQGNFTGILMGLGAAVLYAGVIISNKFLGELPAYEKTTVQLATAGAVVIPYALINESVDVSAIDAKTWILLAVAGLLLTALPYALYFGSMKYLSGQSVALISYIDPITAIILSAIVLDERMGVLEIIGAVLVLGATLISELPERQKKNDTQSDV